MPVCIAVQRTETDEHDFSKHDERSDLRAGGDKRRTRDGCALISIGRPKMERRSGNFECETNEGHDDADGEQRLHRFGG